MTYMKEKIDNHNNKTVPNEKDKEDFPCYCRDKTSCQLKGKCLLERESCVQSHSDTNRIKKTRHIHSDGGKPFQNEIQFP